MAGQSGNQILLPSSLSIDIIGRLKAKYCFPFAHPLKYGGAGFQEPGSICGRDERILDDSVFWFAEVDGWAITRGKESYKSRQSLFCKIRTINHHCICHWFWYHRDQARGIDIDIGILWRPTVIARASTLPTIRMRIRIPIQTVIELLLLLPPRSFPLPLPLPLLQHLIPLPYRKTDAELEEYCFQKRTKAFWPRMLLQ